MLICCYRCNVGGDAGTVIWQEEAEEEEAVVLNKFAT